MNTIILPNYTGDTALTTLTAFSKMKSTHWDCRTYICAVLIGDCVTNRCAVLSGDTALTR